MNLNALRFFVTAAETGSFTRAAERAGIAQPSLSVAMRRLAEELGQPLFVSGRRRADLTPFGRKFLSRARNMLAEYEQARTEARAERVAARHLRLGLLTTLPATPLARLLEGFARAHPEVSLEIIEGSSLNLLNKLSNSRLDAAITVVPEGNPGESAAVFFREPYLLAISVRDRLASRPRVQMADLKGLNFIVRPDCEALRDAERRFAAHGIKPQVAARSTQPERLLNYVRAGMGVALLPESVGQAPDIALMAISDLPLVRRIGMVWRPGAAQAAEPLRDFAATIPWQGASGDQRFAH